MVYFFTYLIYFYATALALLYLTLMIMSYYNTLRYKYRYTIREENYLKEFPEEAPGISIVAPAFNEEVIIYDSVNSLLNLDYPTFEVIIVNDGSKDKTLEILVKEFELEEVPFYYVYKVYCKPVHRILRSRNPAYHRLMVVDKQNGGTKADAMNAGVNVAQYDYFINTDVDCILAEDTLSKIILPVLDSDKPVIAVGATMRMVNGCSVDKGRITRVKPPNRLIPLFQETEYLRSYLVAKMGWSMVNAIANVSGGFGLFDTQVVIAAGGFDSASHAEDMDMTARMVAYMRENNKPYHIAQCPYSLCWTEGPPNIRVLNRQRTRWGRGMLQFIIDHRKFFLNKDYGRLGLLVMPYIVFFEFLAPIIEFTGFLFLLFLLITHQVNFDTFWMMLAYAYLIGLSVSIVTISYDLVLGKLYRNFWEYLKLVLFAALEAILYHPLVVIFTLRGYIQYLTRRKFKWGKMTRQGFSPSKNVNTVNNNA
ncbi:cellulose synthase/poly-beta-1,6-N-acetylglucosamine synthase-like glycosyltransferase [Sphingobacterium allocomposti]|uniref:Cellulose synthase/poly-beta-1,6-N-acetylglucosamine synthase-like glycosyltransferase n=1 Tax=Sphingobacterium allocomposti TaxID=415956 RepID=A0A5S5CW45_9SPHI|nr:glycosyltransferase [Sphingobacterium composti Yoo et al. 2007 non Ten et al. 2007]TYP87825.1 cellulose synthase/poly-beta-1,6-N-acetylglucosamine synthase-like glycosyltransferase [Sphingobacterium composti Yoo et al. 2007 non Ten et al. 2007]